MNKLVYLNNSVDLKEREKEIFEIIDADGRNLISCDEVNEGLQRMNLLPPVCITGEKALSLSCA